MERTMRRFKQRLSEKDARLILLEGSHGVLSLADPDGEPYGVPLSYAYDGNNHIYFHSAVSGHKIDCVKSDPRCSFCVIGLDRIIPGEFTSYFRSVIVRGTLHLVNTQEDIIYGLRLLCEKYSPGIDPGSEISKCLAHVAVLRLDIKDISGKEAIELAGKRKRESAMIHIRKGTEKDIDSIMDCYDKARQFMRETGNTAQWTNGYPSRETVADDIEKGNNYVGEDQQGEIIMTFAFIKGEDPTYSFIENGRWLNMMPYGTIHRLGSSGKHHGILKQCVDYCLQETDNLRLDTHADNIPMQKAAEKLGFVPCGTIYCDDGSPRIAYHKTKTESF